MTVAVALNGDRAHPAAPRASDQLAVEARRGLRPASPRNHQQTARTLETD
jgi:hypothetical protein